VHEILPGGKITRNRNPDPGAGMGWKASETDGGQQTQGWVAPIEFSDVVRELRTSMKRDEVRGQSWADCQNLEK
jgi:hypothetical protein